MTIPKMTNPTGDDDLAQLRGLPELPPRARRDAVKRLICRPGSGLRGVAIRVGGAVLSDDDLIAFLRDNGDATLRNAAVEMLKGRGRKSVPVCVNLLNDRDPDVVLQAVLILDALKDPRTLEPLRRALHHTNPNVVQSAITAIGHLGHARAAADIIPFLEGEPWLRIAAAQALGSLRSPRGLDPLKHLLDDPLIGPVAAESLACIGGPTAFRYVAEHVLASEFADRNGAELLAHVVEGLTDVPPHIDGLREALAARMHNGSGNDGVAAARCLLAMGRGDEDERALKQVAEGIPDNGSLPECLVRREDLIDLLLATRGPQRNWGFQLAARCPDAVSTGAMVAALRDTRGHEHADAVLDAVNALEGTDIGDALLDLYLRLPEDVRSAWGVALGKHRASLLTALLKRTDIPGDQRQVLSAMFETPERAVAAVKGMPPELGAAAVLQMADRTEVLSLLPWADWLEEDAEQYGSLAAAVAESADLRTHLPRLRQLLIRAPSPALITIISNLRDPESAATLIDLVDQGHSGLQPFLLNALGAIGGAAARKTLQRIATGGNPQWERLAFKALSLCSTADDEPFFRAAVEHDDWYVRLACVDVLGNTGRDEDLPLLIRLSADTASAVAQRARSFLETNRAA